MEIPTNKFIKVEFDPPKYRSFLRPKPPKLVRFAKAMAHIHEGGKARRQTWEPETYIMWDMRRNSLVKVRVMHDGRVLKQAPYRFNKRDIVAIDWEVTS